MKRTIKQITAMLLVVIMCVSAPTTALAEGTVAQNNAETVSGQSDVTITGTDSVGNMVAKEATVQQEDQQGKKASISGLNFNGNQAEVEFYTTEDADLVVAVYDEQQVQMLGSGKVTVAAGDTTATVTVNATMPKYFVASAYLLQKDTHKPLCDLYTTQLYTKEIQEVKNSTIDDYKEENVLELDSSDRDNNFAVYNDETVVADEGSKKNQITANGDGTYTVKKADASFTGLKKGDTFSYKYEDGSVLLVKIADILVNGTTVTIREDTNTDLTDFFEYLKIETDGSEPENMSVDENGMDAGVSLIQEMSDTPAATAFQGEGNFEQSVSYSLNDKKLTGTLTLKFSESLNYYIAVKRQYFSFQLAYSMGISGSITKELGKAFSLGKIQTTPVPGVNVAFKPAFVVKASGTISFNAEFKGKLGGSYDSNVGFSDLSSEPSCKSKIVVEGTLFLGFEASIVPSVINEKVCSVEYNTTVGVESKGTQKVDPSEDVVHNCKSCIEGKLNAKLSVDMKLNLIGDMLGIKVTLISGTIKLSDWYYSIDRGEYERTTCPHICYPVDVSVTDKDGIPVKNAIITLLEEKTEKPVMIYTKTTCADSVKTGKTGKVKIYVSNGIYTIKADKDGDVKTKTLTVHDIATSIKLKLSKSVVQPTPTPEVSQDIIKSGVDQNITWKLTKDGTLYLSGKGEMPNWVVDPGYFEEIHRHINTPWIKYKNQIKKVIIDSGITTISEGTFLYYKNLKNVILPNGITKIENEAFRDCISLEKINLPDSLTTLERAFSNCEELSNIKLPDKLKSIGPSCFYRCISLTHIEIPDSVETIGACAFWGCKNLKSIKLSENITRISGRSFNECESLESIEFPKKMKALGDWLFARCTSLKTLYFTGDKVIYEDTLYDGSTFKSDPWAFFEGKVTAYYPADNDTWYNVESNYKNDNVTWVPYDPSTLNAASISEDTINEEVAQNEENSEFTDVPEDNEFADFTDSTDENAGVESEEATENSETKQSVEENLGIENPATESLEPEINSEDTEEVEEIEPLVSYENQPVAATGTMASFSGRMPDSYCLFIVVKDKEAEDILNSENLLYIKQKTADSKGNVSFPYQLRENYANPTSCIYGIEAHTHTYGNWKTIQKATISEAELRQRECSICELTQTKYFGTKLKPMIKLNTSSVTLKIGQSTTGLKVTMSNGDSVLSWKSSNTKVVKVSKTGKLVAQKRAGKATVVVKLNSGLSKQIPVTVQKTTVKTTKITGLKNKITLKAGKTTTLKPVLQPFTSQEKITYTSSNKRVVTVNSKGVLKAIGKGTARIIVKSGKQKFVINVKVA